ncbi:hypothetical protein ABT294_25400 [Nonomuraea sp. NPDC000554]|uniref:hypothetical protein n=1 Tax=Nonomuraea sp. NPDC000554 TaxID=3154259 RepID=UPI003323EBD0
MLTNHDMDSSSPFATVLIGQPTLRRKIKLGVLAALDQRIAVRHHMNGMTSQETTSYLAHHIALAGRHPHRRQRGHRNGVTDHSRPKCHARPALVNHAMLRRYGRPRPADGLRLPWP